MTNNDSSGGRPRGRDLGLRFSGVPGPYNAITDVPGVEVGYETLVSEDGALVSGEGPVRTGVTAILPLGRDGVGRSCPAGWFSLNGNGELTGTAWVDEVGAISLPIGITNTHAVGAVHRGIIEWSAKQNPELKRRWLLPVVGETWDGYLNDIYGRHITPELTWSALDNASGGSVQEGSVGGGTGMNCYEFKGGTGTSSRVVTVGSRQYTMAVLMQANFGARRELMLTGRPLGKLLADDNPIADPSWLAPAGAGSCITIVATDAPLLPGQCKALARRVPLGLARTGTTGSHFSGDLFLAFSTANVGMLDSSLDTATQGDIRNLEFLSWGSMDALYEALVQAVEESIANVLAASTTMIGRDGHRSPGFPTDRLPELMESAFSDPA
ncbi:L-aminopeptidase/D-esterase [Amycolatopsis marina]|uniref:L-aminopeptidase/D-esterase n=1 Tax=Amycolatopsis marina TaxID=490629 RepID=A0A1I1BM42_9PSEU|nr:P1 family peptidase [Amycolatopsis marina]SFB49540.1 L-aminopeptidase/D-esterase [Amycolatopsis marina]